MGRIWNKIVAKPKLAARVTSLFALSFLMLSLVGVYSVVSAAVSHRRGEIGVRMALGASRRAIFQTTLMDGAKISGAGVALGLALAWAGSRVLEGRLFRVSTLDPWIFIAAGVVVFAAALAAAVPPAIAASSVDPRRVLNSE